MARGSTYVSLAVAGAITAGVAAYLLTHRAPSTQAPSGCTPTSPCSSQCPEGVCPSGEVCDMGVCSSISGTVTPTCSVDSSCPIGYVCINGECVACTLAGAPCSSQCPDGSCPGGEECQDGSCITIPCSAPSDCPIGYTCVHGTCENCAIAHAPCSSQCPEGTCPSGSGCRDGVCVPNSPVCLDPCTNDSECSEGYTCVDDCCTFTGGPAPCQCSASCPDGECPSGYFCDDGVCKRGVM